MTDPVDRELPPDEEARISALLAEAGGPVRLPQDVADRLDGVLAGLVDERAGELRPAATGPGEVTPLRRRRRGPALLLAAAAVGTGGFALSAVLDDDAPVTQSTAQDSARDGDEAGGDAASSAGGGVESGTDSPPTALRGMPDRELRLVPTLGPVELTSGRLEAQVLGALRAGRAMDVVPGPEASATGPACAAPDLGAGESWTPAVYAGEPAALVAGPERGETVEASVRSCDGEVLAEVTVDVG